MQKSKSSCLISAVVTAIVIIIGTVVSLGIVVLIRNDNPDNQDDSALTTPAQETILPSLSFETTDELYSAVDRWVAGECTSDSALAATYGYPIGQWDVSKISNFEELFSSLRNSFTYDFNDDISKWDVSNATSMHGMFYFSSSFNRDLSMWDVSSVTDMGNMFNGATAFNADLSKWDVSNVNNMDNMFAYASAFSQNLCAWGTKLPSDVWWISGGVFKGTSCPNAADPDMNVTPAGPFCHPCT